MTRNKTRARAEASPAKSEKVGPGMSVPDDPTGGSVIFWYKNHRGEEGYRRVRPIMFFFGATEWHPEPQMIMRAFDLEKEAERDFAVADMKGFVGSSEVMVSKSDALECWNICEDLRDGEASSVELLCDNPDFNGQPDRVVSCYGDWTKFHPKRFGGDTMLQALKAAQAAKKEAGR